jgi:hypothetical protein
MKLSFLFAAFSMQCFAIMQGAICVLLLLQSSAFIEVNILFSIANNSPCVQLQVCTNHGGLSWHCFQHNYDIICYGCLKISAAELFWDSIISIPSSHWCCPHQTTSFLTWPPPTIFCDLLPSCTPHHDLFFLVSLSCFLSHLLQLKFWC